MKKKLLYIGGFELPDKNAAAHRVLNNSILFEKNGYIVDFIGTYKMKNNEEKYLKVKGIKQRAHPKTFKEWIVYLSSIEYVKKYFYENPDLKTIVAYNYPSIGLKKLLSFCKKNKLKLISDITEWYGPQGNNFVYRTIKGLDSFYRMRILNKKVDGLIVISEYLKNYYVKYNIKTILVHALVNCYDLKWKKSNINNKSLILTYTGQPGRNKDDLSSIIKLISSLKNDNFLILNIVGISKNHFLKIHKLNSRYLNDNIIFHGRVTHKRSLQILANSDFLIFFRKNTISNKAGFPTKFVEATTLGIPTITNNIRNLDRFLIDGMNGIIINNKRKKITNATLKKWNDEKLYLKNNVKVNTFCLERYNKKVKEFLNYL